MEDAHAQGGGVREHRHDVIRKEPRSDHEDEGESESDIYRGRGRPAAERSREEEPEGADERSLQDRPTGHDRDFPEPSNPAVQYDDGEKGHQKEEVDAEQKVEREEFRRIVTRGGDRVGEEDARVARVAIRSDRGRGWREDQYGHHEEGGVQKVVDGKAGEKPEEEPDENDGSHEGNRTMRRAELPAQIGQGKERGLRHGLHKQPLHDSEAANTYISTERQPRLRLVTSCAEDDGPPAPFRSF